MDPKILEDLKTLLDGMKGSYRGAKTETERNVSQWRWATGRYFSLIPFEQERFRMTRGKLLKSEPKVKADSYAFGFDSEERLCLARSIDGGGKSQTEDFTERSDDVILTRTYLATGKTVGKIVQITYRDGLPHKMGSLGAQGDYMFEQYRYKGGLLQSIQVEQFHSGMKKVFTHQYEFAYEKSGTGLADRIEADGKKTASFSFEGKSS